MEAVGEYFIDQVETLRGRDLSEEEREELTEKFQSMYGVRDFYVLYSRFLDREGYDPLPKKPLEKRSLKYEDVYPLLYLKHNLIRCREHREIRHLVVDEMQDYSWVQYLLLKKLFPCRMTILGDKAQTMEENRQDVMEFLPRIFGRNIRKIYMNRSYRNTVEIAEYAGRIVGMEGVELFERHGAPVEEKEFKDKRDALDEVLKTWLSDKDRLETAAVICLTEKEAEEAALYLKEKLAENTSGNLEEISYFDRNSGKFKRV